MDLPIFQSPPSMAWNNAKTQSWETKIQKYGSGKRKTLSRWSYPEWTLECSYTCLDQEEIEYAAGFFAMVRGQHQPFFWLDMEDYHQEKVRIGVGDGINTGFQLVRNFKDLFVEPVYGVVNGTLQIFADAELINAPLKEDGWVEFMIPPASGKIITATFDYYWRVAFESDDFDWTNFWYGFYKLNKIKLVTAR
jgi:uncharacterized protein (TIGR02217 family)